MSGVHSVQGEQREAAGAACRGLGLGRLFITSWKRNPAPGPEPRSQERRNAALEECYVVQTAIASMAHVPQAGPFWGIGGWGNGSGLKSHERCTLWNLWVCNELLQILQWIAWKMLVALPCIRACCSTVAVALTYPGSPTNRRADAPCLGSRHPD